jgi:hypothetical protein
MSAIWSLTEAKRTWQEKLVSVAIDPKLTLSEGTLFALDVHCA